MFSLSPLPLLTTAVKTLLRAREMVSSGQARMTPEVREGVAYDWAKEKKDGAAPSNKK